MARSASSSAPHNEQFASAVITSRDNRWLKRFRAALAGECAEGEAIGVEGARLVEAALGSRLKVEALLLSESGARHFSRVAPLVAARVPVLRTSDKLFAAIADTRTPQGIAALVFPASASMASLTQAAALSVALVGVQDPGNVGTIIRAAEAFGATGVATCVAGKVGTADPFGPKALRASAGSSLRMAVVAGISTAELMKQLRTSAVKVYAAVADANGTVSSLATHAAPSLSSPSLPWEIDWTVSSAILIGNEGAGLPEDLVRAADACVCVPQAPATAPVGIESLNAAMAASVLLYEAMRQRKKSGRKYS
ncbi:MAG TPA: RNA methyltransferase [Candidatus Acidoferrales bacterium]|nr:RNA methyltransferase [Candidatus Acidoferrales bacterium]